MSTSTPSPIAQEIEYPDSDGEPIADNTKQFRWIVTLQGGLDALFRDRTDVFVAGDLLWYPIQGDNTSRAAPDAMVVFGRPKGDRGSYMQWREGGIAPQVVFEVLSPSYRPGEMERKFQFYDRHGVEEYYVYDPDAIELDGWRRIDGALRPIEAMDGWVSPRLGIRFDLSGEELRVLDPDGHSFATYLELAQQSEQERARAEQAQARAEQERARAEQEQARAEQAQAFAEEERARAEHEQARAEREKAEKERVLGRAERLAAQLRALGIEPEG